MVAFIDEDCATLSKREELLKELIARGLQIASWGRCLSGMKVGETSETPGARLLHLQALASASAPSTQGVHPRTRACPCYHLSMRAQHRLSACIPRCCTKRCTPRDPASSIAVLTGTKLAEPVLPFRPPVAWPCICLICSTRTCFH